VQGEEGIERLVEGQKRNTRERRVLRVCWDSGVFFCKRQRVRERESVFLPGRVSINSSPFAVKRGLQSPPPSTCHSHLDPQIVHRNQTRLRSSACAVRDKAENPVCHVKLLHLVQIRHIFDFYNFFLQLLTHVSI
jgi:hypothetical protein